MNPPRPSMPEPEQKEPDEEARLMQRTKEMTERVTFRVTFRLSNEVARLTCKLSTANSVMQKMSAQLTTLLQGAGTPKADLTTKNYTNNETENTTASLPKQH